MDCKSQPNLITWTVFLFLSQQILLQIWPMRACILTYFFQSLHTISPDVLI